MAHRQPRQHRAIMPSSRLTWYGPKVWGDGGSEPAWFDPQVLANKNLGNEEYIYMNILCFSQQNGGEMMHI